MLLLRLVGVGAVLALSFSVARAEEIFGLIRKIEDDKITILKFGKKGEKIGAESTLTVSKKLLVLTAKFNKEAKKVEIGEAIKDGLKNERFNNLKEMPVAARFITNKDGKVTEIHVFPGSPFKGKKKPKKDD